MAVTADSVVVELIARTDGYTAAISGAATSSQSGMSKIEKSASQAEAQVQKSAAAMGSAVKNAANDMAEGSARAAAATRNLGRQVSDIGVGLTGGQNPFLVLAQQAPQVADALADTGGKAAQVASFFAGPWGAALLAAGSALGVLVSKALEGGDSVASLTEQLGKNAEKTRATADAQKIFETTALGAADAIDKLNESLDKANRTQERALSLDLARAKSLRQVSIQALIAAEADAQRARDEAKYASSNSHLLLSGPGAGQAQGEYAQAAAAAETNLAEARKRRIAAEKAVVNTSIPLIDLQASASTDKAAAATLRHERALQKLRDAYQQATLAAKNNQQREAAVQAYRAGRTRIDAQLANDQQAVSSGKSSERTIATATKTLADLRKLEAGATGAERTRLAARVTKAEKRLALLQQGIGSEAASAATGSGGKSAEQLAREAEAKRVKDVRNNEAYNNELEQLNGQIISSQRERANTASEAAAFEREAVDSDYRKRKEGIAADLSAKKYTQQQADTLDGLNDYSRLLKLRNVAIGEDIRTIQDAAARDLLTLDIEAQQLQADQQIAETREQRKKIELELINLKYQERRIQLDALRQAAETKGDTGAVNDLTEQINALPGLKKAEQTGVEQRNRGPYEQYRRNLDNADSLSDSIDAVKIDTLNTITDQLTQATTAALGLKGAFGQIAGELIRIGIQRKLIGPLADALFGKADGSSAGGVGKLLSSVGSIFGRASGGYMAPNSIARVNEGRGGVELLRMGSQGGSVIPLGQTAAPSAARGATIVHAPQFNLKGAVVTRELYADMQRISQQSAAQAGQTAYRQSIEDAPGALGQFQTLKR